MEGAVWLRSRAVARGLLLVTAMTWGASFFLVKAALGDTSPLLFNLLRMSLATAVLIGVNRKNLRSITRGQIKAGSIVGLFLAAGYQLQTLGLTRTTATKSAFLTSLLVIFVPALTLVPLLRPAGTRRPAWTAGLGTVSACAGVVLMTTPADTTFHHLFTSIAFGDLLTLACALAFAAHLLSLAHFAEQIPAGKMATLQLGACTIVMLITLPVEHSQISFTPHLVLTLIFCGVFATAAAFTIQSFAQQVLTPTQTVMILSLEPVFTWLTGLLFLHQILDHRSLLGAILIFAGILMVEWIETRTSNLLGKNSGSALA